MSSVVISVLNAKYIHASPAPWCLAAGVKSYAPSLFERLAVVEATINQDLAEIQENILAKKPMLVSFCCYLWNIEKTLILAANLKKSSPHLTIILGGPEVSYCPEDFLLKNPSVDYILCGEGEESFPKFLTAFFGEQPAQTLFAQKNSLGLCGRTENGSIFTAQPCIIEGEIPSPNLAGYHQALNGRIAYFEASRGCPFSCAFCLSGRCGTPRFFNPQNIFENLLLLANSNTKTIKFVDRTFNASANHCNAILQFILDNYGKAIPNGICFHFEIAGDILREDTFALLEQLPQGAVQLEIGMQSFNEETLTAICRKTNTEILQKNIHRLVAMGNMHIHIDLIAGLPLEDLAGFKNSFNTAFNLKAHMLQLGFLKLLHGSPMRENPSDFPCDFSLEPPYEIFSTPWLTCEDVTLLHSLEDCFEKICNSGRFNLTIDYILSTTKANPFEFFKAVAEAYQQAGLPHSLPLDQFISFFYGYCCGLKDINKECLRDALVLDRLATNSTGRLPTCLLRDDPRLKMAAKLLGENPETAALKETKRGIALLYGQNAICWVDYTHNGKHPVTKRWQINIIDLPF